LKQIFSFIQSERQTAGTAAALVLVALLLGCTVGPDFHRPAPPSVTGYTRGTLPAQTASAGVAGGEEQRFVPNRDIPEQWWMLFQSPQLNALIDQSLKTNPTVTAAQAALRQAQELVYAQQGLYYPTIQANYSPSRQRTSGAISPALASGDTLYNLHTAQLTIGYAPYVFGGNRRQVESLEAQAEAQGYQLEATYLTLTSNVVAAAVQEAGLRAQIAAAKEIIEVNTKSLELLRRQLAAGYVAGLDVAAQEAALAQAQQQLPPLQKQLEQTRNMLAALGGGFPGEGSAQTFDLSALRLPEELPLTLPSRLVEQRPDVRAAEAQLHAASAQIGVAISNMVPQFSISAARGGSASVFSQMFTDGNPFWFVVGNVTQTLFSGGTLLHRKRAAEAAFEQAGAQYKSTVIAAFQNVGDTLYALEADADALKAAVNSEHAAKTSLDLVRKQLEFGQVNYLSLLGAQQTYQQAVISRTQAQASRFADTAALFQALGGGWWNRVPSEALKEKP
jgi:NodT family efflux transporter outer membrane factor (OMF) lipoprotein